MIRVPLSCLQESNPTGLFYRAMSLLCTGKCYFGNFAQAVGLSIPGPAKDSPSPVACNALPSTCAWACLSKSMRPGRLCLTGWDQLCCCWPHRERQVFSSTGALSPHPHCRGQHSSGRGRAARHEPLVCARKAGNHSPGKLHLCLTSEPLLYRPALCSLLSAPICTLLAD